MNKKLVNKNCKQCGNIMENVYPQTQICNSCKNINKKLNIDKQNKNNKEKMYIKHLKEYADNFYECTKNNKHTLTVNGFNKISKIKYEAYRNFHKISWLEIIKYYNKYNELLDYIKDTIIFHINENGNKSISYFYEDKHEHIKSNLIRSIGTKIILNLCGIEYARYDNEDYEQNFINIKNKLGHIPLFHEFVELTNISMNSYVNKFNLKGKIYNNIIKLYSTENEYNNYLIKQKEHKNKIGKQTCNIGKTLLTLEDLEIEFKKVFDKCFIETDKYPSRRLFNKLSKYDDSTYRKKLNMNWTKICKHYGYHSQQGKSIFENYVLKHISNILNEIYEPQMKFDWLIGINNFPLFCDGYFPKHNLIVEVDGRQHRKPYSKFGGEEAFKTLQANDAVKNKLIPEHGILLLRIADNTNWHDVEYLKKRVEEVLNNKLNNELNIVNKSA